VQQPAGEQRDRDVRGLVAGRAGLDGPDRVLAALVRGGAPEAAEALSGQVIATHVHDNLGKLDNHLVPFQGNIDWAATLTAMWKIGYSGPLMFEVADQGDAAAVLARTVGARTRLQAILDGLSEPFRFEE